MNYTTYLYCDCGFDEALTEGEDSHILQCENCYSVASVKKEIQYEIHCSACGEKEEVVGDLVLEKEGKTCLNCGIKGEVGFKEFNKNVLFFVESAPKADKKCTRCRESNWFNPEKHILKCPMCLKKVKQKMSSAWEK